MASQFGQLDPRLGLLDHLVEGVVMQQVGQSHFGVLDPLTQGQIGRNRHTDWWITKRGIHPAN